MATSAYTTASDTIDNLVPMTKTISAASYSPLTQAKQLQSLAAPTPVSATLPQAPAIGYSSAYGGIPQVPSPIATQRDVIEGNIGSLGGLYNLAGPLNLFNQQQAPLGLQTNLLGYQGMIGQSSQNIGSLLRGEIPSDVRNLMAQQAAERGVGTGGIGSPNANAALLRAMGLTSLGLQQQGESELSQAIARTPQGPVFDPSKFFVTPEQQQAAQAAADQVAEWMTQDDCPG